jgi:hypothetical protein
MRRAGTVVLRPVGGIAGDRPGHLAAAGATRAAGAAAATWNFITPDGVARFTKEVAQALADGSWERRHGSLRSQPFFEGSLRLIVDRPG